MSRNLRSSCRTSAGASPKFLPPANELLGQGNIFTSVCHSVQRGRGLLPSMYYGSHDQGGLPPGGGSACRGGLYPGRGSAFSGSWADPTPKIHGILWDTVNKRSVCILLECILVPNLYTSAFRVQLMPSCVSNPTSNCFVEDFWKAFTGLETYIGKFYLWILGWNFAK